jgi:hypothetical protein
MRLLGGRRSAAWQRQTSAGLDGGMSLIDAGDSPDQSTRRARSLAPIVVSGTKVERTLPTTQWDRLAWLALTSAFVAEQSCDAGTARPLVCRRSESRLELGSASDAIVSWDYRRRRNAAT